MSTPVADARNPAVAGASTGPVIAVTSQLMQTYQLATPFADAHRGMVAAQSQSSGDQIEIYSIGSGGTLYQVTPNPASDTGWTATALQLPAATPPLIALALNNTSYQDPVSVYLYALDNTGAVSELQVSGTGVTLTAVYTPSNGIKMAEIRAQGNIVGFRQFGSTAIYVPQPDLTNSPPFPLSAEVDYKVNDWFIGQLQTTNGDGPVAGTFYCYNTDGSDEIAQMGFGSSQSGSSLVTIPISEPVFSAEVEDFPVKQFGTVNGAAGDRIFALHQDGSRLVEFIVDQNSYQLSQPLNRNIRIKSFSAVYSSGAGAAEIYCVGHDNKAYYVCQDAAAPTGWSDLVAIDDSNEYVAVTSQMTSTGSVGLFRTKRNDVLLARFDDSSTDWNFQRIAVAERGDLAEITAYSVQVSVNNADGTPYLLQPISLSLQPSGAADTDSATIVEINGQTIYLDSETNDWTGTTDWSGRLQIVQPVSDLGCPSFNVTLPNVDADPVPLEPFGDVLEQMKSLDDKGVTLKGAQITTNNHGGTALLLASQTSQDDAPQASVAIAKLAKLLSASDATPRGLRLHKRTDRRVVRRSAIVDNGSWKLERIDGRLCFTDLAPEAAGAEASAAASAFKKFWGYLSDVVDAIADGAATCVKIIVHAGEATLHFVIGKVEYYFKQAISAVEDVFGVIGSVFAWIEVKMEQLFQWLSLILNWDDILALHKVMSTAATTMADFLPQYLAALQSTMNTQITNFGTSADSAFGQVIANLTAANPSLQTAAGQPDDTSASATAALFADDHNIVRIGLANNLALANPTMPGPPSLDTNMQALQSFVSEQIPDLESSNGYQGLTQTIGGWTSTEEMLTTSLVDILTACQTLLKDGLVLAQGAFNVIMDGVQDLLTAAFSGVLTAPWDIPWVSEYYKKITHGSELNTIDLISLLQAVPTAIYLKIIDPDFFTKYLTHDFVEQFTSWCTVENLKVAAGISSSTGTAPSSTALSGASSQAIYGVFSLAYTSLGTLVSAPLVGLLDLCITAENVALLVPETAATINALLDALPPILKTWVQGAGATVLSWLTLVINAQNLLISCPLWTQPVSLQTMSCTELDTALNWNWILSVLPFGINFFSVSTTSLHGRISDTSFAILNSLSGLIVLGQSFYVNIQFLGDLGATGEATLAQQYFSVVPLFTPYMHLTDWIVESQGSSYVLMPVIDVTMTVGAAVTGFALAYMAWQQLESDT